MCRAIERFGYHAGMRKLPPNFCESHLVTERKWFAEDNSAMMFCILVILLLLNLAIFFIHPPIDIFILSFIQLLAKKSVLHLIRYSFNKVTCYVRAGRLYKGEYFADTWAPAGAVASLQVSTWLCASCRRWAWPEHRPSPERPRARSGHPDDGQPETKLHPHHHPSSDAPEIIKDIVKRACSVQNHGHCGWC